MKATFTIELEVEVEYFPTAGEPMVAYYANGDGHPGSDPELNIETVTLSNGADVTNVDFPKETWAEIEAACWAALEEEVL